MNTIHLSCARAACTSHCSVLWHLAYGISHMWRLWVLVLALQETKRILISINIGINDVADSFIEYMYNIHYTWFLCFWFWTFSWDGTYTGHTANIFKNLIYAKYALFSNVIFLTLCGGNCDVQCSMPEYSSWTYTLSAFRIFSSLFFFSPFSPIRSMMLYSHQFMCAMKIIKYNYSVCAFCIPLFIW